MDFTIQNDWIVDKDTDKLNDELFGGLDKSTKFKLLRRRKRKRAKTTSQGIVIQKNSPSVSQKDPSLTSKVKKKKRRKIDSYPSEAEVSCVNKHHEADDSVAESKLLRESFYTGKSHKKLKEKKRQKKFPKQSSETSTANLVAKGKGNNPNKLLPPIGKKERIRSLKGKSNKCTIDKGPEQLSKRTIDSAKTKESNLSPENIFSTSKLSQPSFKIKKLRTILKRAELLCRTNHMLQTKSRTKGILVIENGKRKEYSDIIREQAKEKLKSARFRFINEKMYTATGKESLHLFKADPEAFEIYHKGFQAQVDKWPLSPVDVIISDISKLSKTLKIADFGCGNAKIAQVFPDRKVFSFDFISTNNYVTACDMANVPLARESVDIAVFCLALMGTNLNDYLCEAHRVLKMGGQLKIAEVESRMENADTFITDLKKFGFTLVQKNINHKMFIFLDFRKARKMDRTKLPVIELKPCLYKKR